MADIDISCMGLNVSCPEHGRIAMDDDQARHGLPPRMANVLAGVSNLAVGNILIFDASGNPDAIDPEDELRSLLKNPDLCGWDIKTVTGRNEVEKITNYTFRNAHGELKADKIGPAPFEFIRVAGFTPGSAERTHGDVSHFYFDGSNRGRFWVRQWRVTSDGVRHESDFYDANCGGKGIPFGSQA
jgi:hypothetical protein